MRMNAAHHELLSMELSTARRLIREAKYEDAFRHLERAHVLGQAQVRWHVVSHWLLLKVALHMGDGSAALGQAVRMVLGAIGSAVGRDPEKRSSIILVADDDLGIGGALQVLFEINSACREPGNRAASLPPIRIDDGKTSPGLHGGYRACHPGQDPTTPEVTYFASFRPPLESP